MGCSSLLHYTVYEAIHCQPKLWSLLQDCVKSLYLHSHMGVFKYGPYLHYLQTWPWGMASLMHPLPLVSCGVAPTVCLTGRPRVSPNTVCVEPPQMLTTNDIHGRMELWG